MADISGYIRIINEAEKGEAVRDAITGALEAMNTYGGNASTLENHPASYFATATFFTAVAEQVGEVDDVLMAIENGLNAFKYDMGEHTLSGSGGSFTVDCTSIKGYDNLDVSKFYFEILGGSDASQAGNWTPTQSYDPETGIFTYSWGALSNNIQVRLWIIKPTHTTVGVQVQPLVITENGNWDAGNNAAYNPVTIRVPNVIDVRKLTQSITENGVYTFTPEPNTGFNEVELHIEVPMPREKVIVDQTFTENGTYRAIDEEPVADGYGIVTVNVDQKIIADEKTITANGTYDSIDEGFDGYEKVIINVPNVEADLGHKTIGQNGTYNAEDDDLDGYGSVTVAIPTKELHEITITQNGTYDPSQEIPVFDGYSIVEVNVPQSAAVLGGKTITSNGTYDPEDDNLDGYDSVVVNVSGGGGETPNLFKQVWVANVNGSVTINNASYTVGTTMPHVFFIIVGDCDTLVDFTSITVSVNGVDVSDSLAEFYRDDTVGFVSKFIALNMTEGDIITFNVAGVQASGTSTTIYGFRTSKLFTMGEIVASDYANKTTTKSYVEYTVPTSGNYYMFYLARGTSSSDFNELSINDMPYDLSAIGSTTSWRNEIGISNASLNSGDVVKVGGGMWSASYTTQSFGIISVEE